MARGKLVYTGKVKKGADKGKQYVSRLFPRAGNGNSTSVFSILIGKKGKKWKNIITRTQYSERPAGSISAVGGSRKLGTRYVMRSNY